MKKSKERVEMEMSYYKFIAKNHIKYELTNKTLPNSNTDKETKQRIEIYLKEAKQRISTIRKCARKFKGIGLDFLNIYEMAISSSSNIVYSKVKYYSSDTSISIAKLRISKSTILNYISKKDFDELDLTAELSDNRQDKIRFKYYLTYSLADIIEQIYKNKIKISPKPEEKIFKKIFDCEYGYNLKTAKYIYLCFDFISKKMREEELRTKLIDKNKASTMKTKKKI